MSAVHVRILHVEPGDEAGPLSRALAEARAENAARRAIGFEGAGAADVRVDSGPPDGVPFGSRLRALAEEAAGAGATGLVVLGSGAVPLASDSDLRAFVEAAAGPGGRALTNNRFSSDIVAVSGLGLLQQTPRELSGDNALPRWLSESAGYEVADFRDRWRLSLDLDSPLDLLLVDPGRWAGEPWAERAVARIVDIARVAADPGAELIVAGRTSAATLAHLERSAACRVRALVEERGLRTAPAGQRPPRSVLGTALDVGGPATLGSVLARFGDAAVVDTRVLLAHRLGRDERRWPGPEDRFASDLLLPERIRHPWLRALTASAVSASIAVLVGGHTVVGPGMRLIVRDPRDEPAG